MPLVKTCPRCGGPVHCLSEAVERCDCMRLTLTPETLGLMRSQYQDCLCPACLAAIANALDGGGALAGPSGAETG
jgi:hypothetical protein